MKPNDKLFVQTDIYEYLFKELIFSLGYYTNYKKNLDQDQNIF